MRYDDGIVAEGFWRDGTIIEADDGDVSDSSSRTSSSSSDSSSSDSDVIESEDIMR